MIFGGTLENIRYSSSIGMLAFYSMIQASVVAGGGFSWPSNDQELHHTSLACEVRFEGVYPTVVHSETSWFVIVDKSLALVLVREREL